MRHQLYKYENNGLKLDFSFPEDDKILQNKENFKDLLVKAIHDLTIELSMATEIKPITGKDGSKS